MLSVSDDLSFEHFTLPLTDAGFGCCPVMVFSQFNADRLVGQDRQEVGRFIRVDSGLGQLRRQADEVVKLDSFSLLLIYSPSLLGLVILPPSR
jgi:hypothetical protein